MNEIMTSFAIAKKYNVSNALVRRWAKNNNLELVYYNGRKTYPFSPENIKKFENRPKKSGRSLYSKVAVIFNKNIIIYKTIQQAYAHVCKKDAFFKVFIPPFSPRFHYSLPLSPEQKENIKSIISSPSFSGKLIIFSPSVSTPKLFQFYTHLNIPYKKLVELYYNYVDKNAIFIYQEKYQNDDDFYNSILKCNQCPEKNINNLLKKVSNEKKIYH